MRICINRILGVLILLGVAFFAKAQETTSEIGGNITDANGAVISGATITAIHTPTGTKYVTSSRKDGGYNLANVKIGGPYTITVTFVGFKDETQENIVLVLGQEFKADFKLTPIANNLTEVVVKSAAQGKIFNNNHTGSQEIITRDQLERLPTINRSLQDFTKLTPTANGLAFAGQSNQYNNLTVDGANFNNSFGLSGTLGGQTNSQPISLEAIEQIQVNVSPYDVRQGGFSGAGINTVTKSGTNTFKGSIYTYTKGAGTQGYNVGDVTLPKQDLSYNLRGFTLGGPIIKNKLFFFISGESERRTDPGTQFVAYDQNHQPDGISVSAASAALLQQLADTLKARFGYDPGAFQGYSYKTQSDKITAKIDWNIGKKSSLTIKYNYLNSHRDIQASNSGSVNSSYGRTPGQYAMPFYGSGYTIFNNFNIIIAELNTRFSNRISNKLQVGYTALRDYRNALSGTQTSGKNAGQYMPLVDILDGNGNPFTSFGYEQYTYGNKLNTDVFQVNDILSIFAGKHEITLGTQNSFKKYENGFSPAYEGVFRFNSLDDFYASLNGTKPAARYDLSASLKSDGSFPLVGPKDQEYSVFAQDKWRIKNNLTLTYGVRIDMAVFQNTFLYNPVVDTLSQFYAGTHVNTGQGPKTAALFSPRVGFNWDVFSDHKTQVRGGVGLFAGPPPFVWISNQASNSGVALFGSISNGAGYMFNSDPNAYRSQITSTAGGLSKSYSINVTDPNFKFPQALKASVAIDQKLPDNFVVTFEYTIARDVNAAFFENINLPNPVLTLPDGRPYFRSTQIYPVGGSAAASATNPSIGNAIYMTNVNKGYAYTATVQVQKTFRNLYLNAAYTYQQSKDVMVGGSTAATMWGSKPVAGNPNSPELGYSNAYLPHRIIISAAYRKEYAKHFATSLGAIFEAAPNGTSSYVYTGDLNGDGQTSNDLLYIPTTQDIQNYVANGQLEASAPTTVVTYNNGVATSTKVNDTRTPDQIGQQLNAFINQSDYLSKHRGQIAQRNALIYPWFKRLDLNLTQDFYIFTKDNTKHTLRFTIDLINAGNLLNKNWGIYQVPNVTSLIKVDKVIVNGTTVKPIFSFPYQVGGTQTPYSTSWKDDVSILSRWQMQFGFRYLFN
ncbi:MAG TPA: carboxypeptidase regulatory-like domain-containing protein [Chitinophagaceae bacterium]|nr:carboxypeptidase regulatory-like domain-containing protein [Chitinophagaceae bacterium]